MTMKREPSMIVLISLSAVLATPSLAQTGNILNNDYQIMVPEKGYKPAQPEPWLAPKYRPGAIETVRIPKPKTVRHARALIRGMSTFHRQDGRSKICRHCRAQVRVALRPLRIAA